MFKELADLTKSTSIHLILSASGDNELKVVVLPQTREGMNPALCQPLILTATPEELDEKFVNILCDYKAARKSLEEQLEDAKLVMEAAGKSAQDATTSATKKASPKPTPASAPTPTVSEETEGGDAETSTTGEDGDDFDLFS